LGPSDSYENVGYWIGDAGYPDDVLAFACDFYPSNSGTFDELWTAMWSHYPSDPLKLTLAIDESGMPGSVLWSSTITNQLGNYPTVLHLDNLNGPQIFANQRYWLTAELPSPASEHHHVWDNNALSDYGTIAYSQNGGPWQLDQANALRLGMRIGVVPEPSTFVLLGMGAFSLLVHIWRQRK
jgi:hypothetical protein